MDKIERNQIPEKITGKDITRLDLTPAEGYILSQIDGYMSVDDLRQISGLREEDFHPILSKFVTLRIIKLKEPGANASSTPTKSAATNGDALRPFEERVREIYITIDEMDHYSVLGVSRVASPGEIKQAYHELTKEFHPDRLFRKGSDDLRERLQYIFARINEVYKILSNDKVRWEYDKSLKEYEKNRGAIPRSQPLVKPKWPSTVANVANTPNRPPQPPRKPEPPPTIPAQNPFTETVLKAKRMYEDALKEIKRKNYSAAKANLRIAATLDPFNKTYSETIQKIEGIESKDQARKYFDEAVTRELNGEMDEAAKLYREATMLDGDNAKYYTKWARILILHKNNALQAKTVVQKAFTLGGKDPEQYLILGLVMKDQGQRPGAQAQFEAGLKIDPDNRELQRELKKIKKGK